MSLQIIETGEVVDPMGRVEAERITTRIADLLDGIADNIDQVIPLIREALTRQAWAALDYNGPSDYISERFSGALQRLSPEVRRPFAAELSAAGMSTRAIAPIVGVDQSRVARDVQVMRSASPAASGTTEHGLPTTDRIVGMDGKQYRRPEPRSLDEWRGEVLHQAEETGEVVKLTGPKSVADPSGRQQSPKPRRTPLTDQFRNATTDLTRKTETIARLCDDDRFPRNAEEVATSIRSDLIRAIDALTDVVNLLDSTTKKEELS
ncbi:hypothetical protein DUY81_08610 [Acidipropionibacterium acidipropionici]|jgi:hypothetical protein|uniref:Uncharacterized protein n=1 Tax=Acidipropionibacterium acidipropionici TaxID=1748 RepID=A0AAC8YD89_9ACTN|nr:hypothetical protein [Acidipropionibacterium acidipropionici]AMS04626.1 hypothetical protein AXH35_03170 [Acidipropionibacterium acidipropionici]AOZ46115.1 hypothetical protein A8L58_04635 [Acidipropionibacterium acidipropionici]AZP37855.1 hypothetical protein DUY81_08610 [Acidipropionibacterium acidipropionici]